MDAIVSAQQLKIYNMHSPTSTSTFQQKNMQINSF